MFRVSTGRPSFGWERACQTAQNSTPKPAPAWRLHVSCSVASCWMACLSQTRSLNPVHYAGCLRRVFFGCSATAETKTPLDCGNPQATLIFLFPHIWFLLFSYIFFFAATIYAYAGSRRSFLFLPPVASIINRTFACLFFVDSFSKRCEQGGNRE